MKAPSQLIQGRDNVNAVTERDGVFGGANQDRLRLSLDSLDACSRFPGYWSRADGPVATDADDCVRWR
jgi:hypothetical protein